MLISKITKTGSVFRGLNRANEVIHMTISNDASAIGHDNYISGGRFIKLHAIIGVEDTMHDMET